MAFPTPYKIQRLPWVGSGSDAHGNITETWGDPIDVDVHGWAAPDADQEPAEDGRHAVVRDLDLYAPGGTQAHPKDHWDIPGKSTGHCLEHPSRACFSQVGHVEDYTTGPWQWVAGICINLDRVEG